MASQGNWMGICNSTWLDKSNSFFLRCVSLWLPEVCPIPEAWCQSKCSTWADLSASAPDVMKTQQRVGYITAFVWDHVLVGTVARALSVEWDLGGWGALLGVRHSAGKDLIQESSLYLPKSSQEWGHATALQMALVLGLVCRISRVGLRVDEG